MRSLFRLAYDIGLSETALRNFLREKPVKNSTVEIIGKAVSMNKKEFEELYYKYKTKQLCEMLKVSAPTIYKRIKQLGIKPKGQGKGARKLVIE